MGCNCITCQLRALAVQAMAEKLEVQILKPILEDEMKEKTGSEFEERLQEHQDDWLYHATREITEEVRQEQIAKGAEKYDKPLGAAKWSFPEIIKHAFQENIDQAHYLTKALHQYEDEKERRDEFINEILDDLEQLSTHAKVAGSQLVYYALRGITLKLKTMKEGEQE